MTLEALSAVTPLTLRRGSFRPPDKLVALPQAGIVMQSRGSVNAHSR